MGFFVFCSIVNPNFAEKAPKDIVSECRVKLSEAESQAALARKRLADLV